MAENLKGLEEQRQSSLSKKPHYHGHRDRLRTKFREVGPSALAEYELLEMLLFRTFPRMDTKPVAKDLLNLCKSFNNRSGLKYST